MANSEDQAEADSTETRHLKRKRSQIDNADSPQTPPPKREPNIPWDFTTPVDYGTADAYCKAVQAWLCAYQGWQMAQWFAPIWAQQQTMLMMQQNQVSTVPNQNQTQAASTTPAFDETHYRISNYGKRAAAELIDFCFCFFLKLTVIFTLVEFRYINIEKYERLMSSQSDLQTLIDVTQDLFPLELAGKLIISIIEALYISYGFGAVPSGCTPGKFLLAIRVLQIDAVEAVAPRDYRVRLSRPRSAQFTWSLLRAFVKNVSLSFIFPVCVMLYAFPFNRSAYDIACRTVVVDDTRPRPRLAI